MLRDTGPDVPAEKWNDWKWQLKNRVSTLAKLEQLIAVTSSERAGALLAGSKLSLSVTPHFFNPIEAHNPDCPIRRQVIPRIEEGYTAPWEMADPCGEDSHMPVPGLVHRFSDRVLFLVTDRCASYCRYCTRSRVVSGAGEQELHTDFDEAFAYLQKHTEVRDVLLSGGDPLLFSDEKLEYLIGRVRAIPHIEFVRIGTRVPVFLPQRITPQLCQMLQKYHPLWMSGHVNHPRFLPPLPSITRSIPRWLSSPLSQPSPQNPGNLTPYAAAPSPGRERDYMMACHRTPSSCISPLQAGPRGALAVA